MKTADLRSEMEKIYNRHGHLTPEIVRDEARVESHPLHCAVFDRTPELAAEAYYLRRAHELITSLRVTYKPDDKPEETIRLYHAVRLEEGYAYHPADKIAQDPFQARLVLADMEREWRQLRARYEQFAEFWELIRGDTAA